MGRPRPRQKMATNETGLPYNAQSVRAMLNGPQKRVRATRRPPLG
jgi:hypothetical protein